MAEYTIEENDSNRRVDRVLRSFLKESPLPLIYSSIRKGLVKLNGKKTKAEARTSLGDILYVDDSLELFKKKEKSEHSEREKFDIILKTDDLLFLNKGKGIITHGKGSIDEKVKKSFIVESSLSFSIGALHRLDKNTTGVLTFSQSLKGASLFSSAILDGNINRYYIGVNEGRVKEGFWKVPSEDFENDGKFEMTHVSILEYSKKENLSLSFYKLLTGKKHQIRKGSKHFLTPLFCDYFYGSKRKDYPSYFLHSICLHFEKIIFDDIPSFVIAPIPNDFCKIIKLYFPKTNKSLNENGVEKIAKTWINELST